MSAQGNLLLAAGGTNGNVSLFADVTATTALSIDAEGFVVLESDLGTTGAGATIDVLAGGAIEARQGSGIATLDGDIQLDAGGDITLESVDAGDGTVRMVGAAVIDGDADEDTDTREVDIAAAGLQVTATGGVGALANALETPVGTLSVDAGGDIAVAEGDDLRLDTVGTTVDRVGIDGAATSLGEATLSDVEGNQIEIRCWTARWKARATGRSPLRATCCFPPRAMIPAWCWAAASPATAAWSRSAPAATGAGRGYRRDRPGRHRVRHRARRPDPADGVSIRTNDGDAVVGAYGTLTLETVDVGAGDLYLAGEAIVDGDADADTDVDIFAAGLVLQTAAGSAGTAANALETAVDTLAAELEGDLFWRKPTTFRSSGSSPRDHGSRRAAHRSPSAPGWWTTSPAATS
ncbi:hypothetical protein HK414_15785 [Ramlibacter terrae]|uniref:Carbohydrate-binding domain-containing protein n=1 Tax=Ramlibacter terrae TaxID=2732511 RepID=A0ABX6P525_9BURK|nr:hypothetical protein HK414_15785 [Ramlibacter terrae]